VSLQATETAQQLHHLAATGRERICGLGRASESVLKIHRGLMEHPIATSGWLFSYSGYIEAMNRGAEPLNL